MPLATTAALEILKAALKAVDPSWRSGASRYLGLHTANPGVGGNQTTSECAYTGYLRVAITAATGWSDANPMLNSALIQFAKATAATTELITHLTVGTASSGTGQVLVIASLVDPLQMAINIQPQFGAGDISVALS